MKMNTGDILAVLASVLLVFTPLLDARITCGIGVALIIGLLAYHFAGTFREVKVRRREIENERRKSTEKYSFLD